MVRYRLCIIIIVVVNILCCSLGQNAFSRAYLNLINRQDIAIFMEKFDGYVFVDSKGNNLNSFSCGRFFE